MIAVIPITLETVEQFCEEAMALAVESRQAESAEAAFRIVAGAMQGLVTVNSLIGQYCYMVEAPRRQPLQPESVMCLRVLEWTLQKLQRQRDGFAPLIKIDTNLGLYA